MKFRQLVSVLSFGAGVLLSADVLAANVDNATPVDFEIDFPINTATLLYFGTNGYVMPFGSQSGWTGYIAAAVSDSSGTIDYSSGSNSMGNAVNIGSLVYQGSQIKGQLVVTNVSGAINAKGGAANPLHITLTVRVKFSDGGNKINGTCQTSTFNVTIGTDKSTSWSSSWSGVAYDSSNGTFQAVAQDFGAIPGVTGAGCPTGGAFVGDYINATLNLGSNVSAALQYAGGVNGQPTFNPVLHGS